MWIWEWGTIGFGSMSHREGETYMCGILKATKNPKIKAKQLGEMGSWDRDGLGPQNEMTLFFHYSQSHGPCEGFVYIIFSLFLWVHQWTIFLHINHVSKLVA